MKIHPFFILLLFTFTISLNVSANYIKKKGVISPNDSIESLKIEALKKAYKKNDQLTFLKLFPDTFDEFIHLYEYDKRGKSDTWNSEGSYIEFIFRSNKDIDESVYMPLLFNKIIKISIQANQNADIVNYFRYSLLNIVGGYTNYTALFLDILAKFPHEKRIKFWEFMFAGPLANQCFFNETYRTVKSLNPKQANLLLLTYQKRKKGSKNILKERSQLIIRAFEKNDYASFLYLFPNTFSELIDYYGFDEKTGKHPLYSLGESYHINFLFSAPNKYLPQLFLKVVDIAIDGKWDADSINLFQDHLIKFILTHTKGIIEILTSKTISECKSFWHFVFDGPIPNKDDFSTVYKKIKPLNKKQAKILRKVFKKMAPWQ